MAARTPCTPPPASAASSPATAPSSPGWHVAKKLATRPPACPYSSPRPGNAAVLAMLVGPFSFKASLITLAGKVMDLSNAGRAPGRRPPRAAAGAAGPRSRTGIGGIGGGTLALRPSQSGRESAPPPRAEPEPGDRGELAGLRGRPDLNGRRVEVKGPATGADGPPRLGVPLPRPSAAGPPPPSLLPPADERASEASPGKSEDDDDVPCKLAHSGVCAAYERRTNKLICYLNSGEDEVVRSLFYNNNNNSLITVAVSRRHFFGRRRASQPGMKLRRLRGRSARSGGRTAGAEGSRHSACRRQADLQKFH